MKDLTGEPAAPSVRRDELMTALIEASLELAAAEPPSAISLRDIAQTAGVRHSDVHRYFGGKKQLIRAAMQMAAEREIAILRSGAPGPGDTAEQPRREELMRAWSGSIVGRVFLWAAMEGMTADELLPAPLPSMAAGARYAARRRREVDGDAAEGVDARVVVAVITAIVMSFQAAEPLLIRAAGLDQEDLAWVRKSVAQLVAGVYGMAAPDTSRAPRDEPEPSSADDAP